MTCIYMGQEVWSADIELAKDYDEGVRGDRGNRRYETYRHRIGQLTGMFEKFVDLLKEFPWEAELE